MNDRTLFAVLDDFLPVLLLLGFVVGDNRVTFFVLKLFEENFEFGADLEVAHIDELRCVDDAFGFATNVNNDFGGVDLYDCSLDNGTFFKVVYVAIC